ncbi:GAF domain-containing protein [Longimicrobium sp.]|uniref:GAF domain-containing protein n=1 Tax=Longimicrobium sp. TaxID=2029185 RepID=UPI002E2F2181|nr:GAF domain-containing protein [Longimicrobium sp.]HEX6040138.1 GAF domain-containing protein [Longimicrobium sp.]
MTDAPRRDPSHDPPASLDQVRRDPARLAAVHATGLLDTPAEPAFDRLTRMAVRLLRVPATFLSLVDEERDFYKSAAGFGEPLASARELAGRTFCHFSIAGADGPLVIPDTRADPLYAGVPTVESLGVAAYMGVPVMVDGQPVGSFCAIDMAPRQWTRDEVEVLTELGASAQREIELRRALERAQRTARERDEFLNATSDGVYTIDAQGRITFANHAAATQLGYAPEEMLGRVGHELFHYAHADGSPYPAETCAIARAARAGQAVRTYGEVLWRKDGTSFPVAYASSPLLRDGEVAGAVVRFTDVTEQKRAEDGLTLLARSGRVLSSSLEVDDTLQAIAQIAVPALAEMVMVDVLEGDSIRRVAASHAASRLEALFQRARDYPPRPGDGGPQAQVVRTGEPLLENEIDDAWIDRVGRGPAHADLLRDLGPRSLVVVPIRAGQRVLGTLSLVRTAARPCFDDADVELAEELALRAALAMENARLYDAARGATRARDDMLGVVSHDLRNPIHSIFMSSSFLLELLPEERKVERTQAAVIKRAAERANRLIQDLLDITQIESGRLSLHRERHDAASIAGEALELAGMTAADRGIALARGPMEHAPLLVDRDRVLQALGNLVSNALKFTPSGGRVTLCAETAADEVCFSVADTGPGIAAAQVPHLFDRYWQANTRDRRGVGLGLSIVRGIADAHGGRVEVRTREGQGTTFTLILPVADGSAD